MADSWNGQLIVQRIIDCMHRWPWAELRVANETLLLVSDYFGLNNSILIHILKTLNFINDQFYWSMNDQKTYFVKNFPLPSCFFLNSMENIFGHFFDISNFSYSD